MTAFFEYSTSSATNRLKELFGQKVFDGPKPVPFVKDLIHIGTSRDSIVLDFFAGSGTTAQAVFELNKEDGGDRKSILVQWPEIIPEGHPAKQLGFENISQLSRQRIRLAGQELSSNTVDSGFRVLKIDTSNMADVYYTPNALAQKDLLANVENIKPGRDNPEDLLFQVLLDWGVDLTLPIEKRDIQGKSVFFVNEEPYDLIACFDKGVTEELVKELASHQPMRVVFRDNGFVSDAVKINVEQIFRQLSPATDVKSI